MGVPYTMLEADTHAFIAARYLPPQMTLKDPHIDCPKSGPGPVQRYFAGPGPGPLGPGRHLLALDLDLSGPGPEGPGQVRSRSGPGPHGKKKTIYIHYHRELRYNLL